MSPRANEDDCARLRASPEVFTGKRQEDGGHRPVDGKDLPIIAHDTGHLKGPLYALRVLADAPAERVGISKQILGSGLVDDGRQSVAGRRIQAQIAL